MKADDTKIYYIGEEVAEILNKIQYALIFLNKLSLDICKTESVLAPISEFIGFMNYVSMHSNLNGFILRKNHKKEK